MPKAENKRRFERDLILGRVQRHLVNRADAALPPEKRCEIWDACEIVTRVWNIALLEDEFKDACQ